jgi:hypothetical protein
MSFKTLDDTGQGILIWINPSRNCRTKTARDHADLTGIGGAENLAGSAEKNKNLFQ